MQSGVCPVLETLREMSGRLQRFEVQGMEEMHGLISFYKQNATMLRETFVEMGFSVYGGTDAPYVWVGFPGRDSWEVFAEILDKCDIVTTPGSGFGPAGDGFVRVSAFGSRDNVEEAIQRFRASYGKVAA